MFSLHESHEISIVADIFEHLLVSYPRWQQAWETIREVHHAVQESADIHASQAAGYLEVIHCSGAREDSSKILCRVKSDRAVALDELHNLRSSTVAAQLEKTGESLRAEFTSCPMAAADFNLDGYPYPSYPWY